MRFVEQEIASQVLAPLKHLRDLMPGVRTLIEDITATGARVVSSEADPMVELVRAERFAVAAAAHRGLDPDAPRNLTRSIVLSPGQV